MTTVPDRTTFEAKYAGQAPWDIGKPQKPFLAVADRITGSLLDAGCGTGDTALYFAGRGCQVTGIDFIEEAIKRARRKSTDQGVPATFLVMDALSPIPRPQTGNIRPLMLPVTGGCNMGDLSSGGPHQPHQVARLQPSQGPGQVGGPGGRPCARSAQRRQRDAGRHAALWAQHQVEDAALVLAQLPGAVHLAAVLLVLLVGGDPRAHVERVQACSATRGGAVLA